jgi:hypothetical protein
MNLDLSCFEILLECMGGTTLGYLRFDNIPQDIVHMNFDPEPKCTGRSRKARKHLQLLRTCQRGKKSTPRCLLLTFDLVHKCRRSCSCFSQSKKCLLHTAYSWTELLCHCTHQECMGGTTLGYLRFDNDQFHI